MAFMRSLCLALAWVVPATSSAGRGTSVVTATGRATPVVRRVRQRTARAAVQSVSYVSSHASAFSGLLRTDRYSVNRGMNCSVGHGGDEISSMAGLSLAGCQKSCEHDDACTCVAFEASSGNCGKHRNCHIEDCVPSELVDTYMLHSTFKLPKRSAPGSLQAQVQDEAKGHDEGIPLVQRIANSTPAPTSQELPQTMYERSGGRSCSNATVLASFNVATAIDVHLSVIQCLTHCQQTTSCTCVKYERYYKSECFLLDSCPLPTFCARSDIYDTYVLLTTTPAPAPAR